ncbi:MAG TPA: SurA N-terminal domain-containing protein [Beijerinckia sp.]|jgi:peptidyl-prolyl cis-trans isomerase D|nr:SurA N-terminal domain-containing protein [Beijerinckia sp.]
MLESLRAASQGWIGRSILAIVMGFIILSFAIWGIGDIFRNFGANKLASVGGSEITTEAYRNAYQTELQRLQRQARRAITNDEARMFGLDRQVLARLVSGAALDEQAKSLGLAISDQDLAKTIVNDDSFKGINGSFDRQRFEELLRDNGLTEKGFVRDQRNVYLRHEITDALIFGLAVPKAMLEPIHRYQSETRSVGYFVLPPSAAGEIPPPSQEELQKYFDDRAQGYRTPEFRKLVTLTLTPASLAKPEAVSEAQAQKRYEEVKNERFTSPEKRAIEQIVFPDEAAATAARMEIDQGKTFDALIAERKLTSKDVDLGLVTRDALVDKGVADAAFALPEGAVSAPVKAQFGSILLRVTKIIPASLKPFAEVEDDLKHEIALAQAKGEAANLHDQIEDQRSSGKSLAEAAKTVGLEVRSIDAIDTAGHDKQGAPVQGLVNGAALLKAAFASDVGVDNDTLTMADGGYQWFEVASIDPARQQKLDEVKPQVEKAWRDDETAKRLSAKSADLIKKIDEGTSLDQVAQEAGNLTVEQANDVKRSGSASLPANAVAQIFNVGVHGAGSVADTKGGRILFQVTDAAVPPMDITAKDLAALSNEVKNGLIDDMISQYLAKLESDLGTRVNMQALTAATGAY